MSAYVGWQSALYALDERGIQEGREDEHGYLGHRHEEAADLLHDDGQRDERDVVDLGQLDRAKLELGNRLDYVAFRVLNYLRLSGQVDEAMIFLSLLDEIVEEKALQVRLFGDYDLLRFKLVYLAVDHRQGTKRGKRVMRVCAGVLQSHGRVVEANYQVGGIHFDGAWPGSIER